MVVDVALLAKEVKQEKKDKDPPVSLAPLVVPKLRANSGAPLRVSLVGRF